jgi:uncharacterized protein YqfA (UPF0365 family)
MEMKHKVIKKGFPRIIQTWNNGTKVYRVDCRKEGLLKAKEKNIDLSFDQACALDLQDKDIQKKED